MRLILIIGGVNYLITAGAIIAGHEMSTFSQVVACLGCATWLLLNND